MEEQLQEDWLDARLREEAPYLDDNRFTAGVMQQLPAARPHRRSIRAAILLGATLVACLIAFLLAGDVVVNSAAFLVALPVVTVCVIAGICALLVTAVATTAAFARVRGQRL